MSSCLFCEMSARNTGSDILLSNKHAFAVRDNFPISPGHTLIIPRRHTATFFETSPEERQCLLDLLDAAKAALDKEFSPDGYNVGINDGPAAGQTILHLHIHLIPRFTGDQKDPRGGVRWIFPSKAKYWP